MPIVCDDRSATCSGLDCQIGQAGVGLLLWRQHARLAGLGRRQALRGERTPSSHILSPLKKDCDDLSPRRSNSCPLHRGVDLHSTRPSSWFASTSHDRRNILPSVNPDHKCQPTSAGRRRRGRRRRPMVPNRPSASGPRRRDSPPAARALKRRCAPSTTTAAVG